MCIDVNIKLREMTNFTKKANVTYWKSLESLKQVVFSFMCKIHLIFLLLFIESVNHIEPFNETNECVDKNWYIKGKMVLSARRSFGIVSKTTLRYSWRNECVYIRGIHFNQKEGREN